MTRGFGVDIGGTGVKGAIVDLETGTFASDRVRIPTPHPATVDALVSTVKEIADKAGWDGPFGCTFPGVVQRGVVHSAANLDPSWIDVPLDERLSEATGQRVRALNDADAAGLAEVRYGAGRGRGGVILVTTLGTGIGSALFVDGTLVPNTELGHLELDGHDAETQAANSAREREGLSFKEWAVRLQRYYSHVEMLFSPDLFIVGGGVSKKAAKFLPELDLKTPIIPAELLNTSGIVGAAAEAAKA